MKRLLLAAVVLIAGSSAFAQSSFQVEDLQGNNITGQTIDLWVDQTYATYSQDFQVKNISGNSKFVMAKRHHLVVNAPGYELFCWVLCYGPSTNVSPTAANMTSNSIHSFSSHYFHQNTYGVATTLYTFYDSLNVNDSASFIVNWHVTPTSVNDLAPVTGNISAIYPNPASSVTAINYTLNNADHAYLNIYDLLGNQIRHVVVNPKDNSVSLNVADLKAGLYFCSLVADDKAISTQKLTVVK